MSMTGDALRNLFLSKYQEFRKRLRIRLGSEDLANDAMQEAWLRVDSLAETAPVEYPAAYLFKIASNIAEDQRRANARILSMAEIEELYDMADEAAGPAQVAEGREQLAALEAALAELPRRRQAIVIAARVDEVPHREIAERFGISVRTVEKELRAGLEHCCGKLEKKYVQRYGPQARETS
ncbi:MAG: RNA polymerase sigma factor [Achromobacter sp.]|jgi:RNA polymerase sigma factor (sigma-70 family)|uniref:RNA polymerase sigma factor 70 region 4 type 2 domain-containing protein n=2 Tax=Alcaligenaceae TaxID=506 RepID=A0A6J5BVV9_9BURK|nr:RNA polymerase sigma factor [Achromobacter insuavis]MBN9637416.1 RNA polymerase sigma factor [Achromobacter sp.]CUI36274.1 Probable RNA polymerase sigma factor fecI [Achromobacter sp. 2789STDY5608621]CUI89551.1 Probable RNA polymerase sigma factor fecI [Achromobacter sp. 2789STDY5608628]CUJ31657.1 Probable RNA polymerase sigma factor fecI [Achromobacter sp. 2789STDY5608633]CUK12902.1 Probable RNA polymerase sigma factor fecI [Achromobacter sp. 2789STDY5608615]